MKRLITRGDVLVIAALLALSLLAFALPLLGRAGSEVQVRAPGGAYVYALSKDGVYRIEGRGGALTLQIDGGAAFVSESDCPDKLCVRVGRLSRAGDTAACLPLGIVVTITGGRADVDAETH